MPFVCRSCSSTNITFFLDLGEQPHCNRLVPPTKIDKQEPSYPLRVGFCNDCTLVQIDHTIPKEEMFSDYPYVSGTTRTLVNHFSESAARLVETYRLKETALVVDIGSNDGSWLSQYKPFGLRIIGVEAADNVAAIARQAGIPTMSRFFNETTAQTIISEFGEAHLVTAAGVFFHLEELHSVVRGIHELIGDDGVLVVQAIYLGGMIENVAFDQIYHEHLCYYTLRSASNLLSRHGLEVIDVKMLPIHGGSIEIHAARRGRRPVSRAVSSFQLMEYEKRLGEVDRYEEFAKNVWILKEQLLTLLREWHHQGRSVWAYGAPAKGATLLNSFGIGPTLVQQAVEKNRMKVGYYMPGSRVPVVSEGTGTPDAYLVLAWNFLDEFIAKEREYLESGGSFIVPVPKVHVITASSLGWDRS